MHVEPPDAELMAALQAGDEPALETLIGRWQQPLLRFVFRYVQNETEARDLVHETFVRLHETRRAYRSGGAFSGWIFTIAANLARNHVRWRKRHPAESDSRRASSAGDARELSCSADAPDMRVLVTERVLSVRRAIDALPHDLKTTLLLFEYEELSYREIAAVVGCSEKGVEARLARARTRLREMLADYFADTSTTARESSAPVIL
jgi:RNA polymerase sigma-70 factor (ECF subfamily)